MIRLAELDERAAADRLCLFGAFHPTAEDRVPFDGGTLVLLGPAEPGFWAHLTAQPEFNDGAPDPIDRWSARAICAIAQDMGGRALFPFGVAPPLPFFSWALRSGRCWSSPVGFLVHETAGLWASFRGALAFAEKLELPAPVESPCERCEARPCLSACRVGALTGQGYDLAACHAYLDQPEGRACLEKGCLVRSSCPVSHRYGRLAEQSAFHMARFHP
ncbi:ferredoxin [Thioclava sp. BHET1]|nr:ferredoxin [Thioclava sp. BHET1]